MILLLYCETLDISMDTLAKIVSFIFHPLFIIGYVLALVMVINPYLFYIQEPKVKGLFLISTFMLTTFFPILSISMMRALGLIKNFKLEDRRERIGPMIVTSVFYLWLFLNIKDNPGIPGAFSFFVLGCIIGLFLAFFINNFQKISLHGVAAGGFLMGMLIIGSKFSYGYFLLPIPYIGTYSINIVLLYVVILMIGGMILSSRLVLRAHSKHELYGGFFIGAVSQIFGYILYF